MSSILDVVQGYDEENFTIFNGPVTAGLSALSEDYIHDSNKLILPIEEDIKASPRALISAAVGSVLKMAERLLVTDVSVKYLACAIAVLALKQNILDQGSIKSLPAAQCRFATNAEVCEAGKAYKNAATIVAAAKVNYLHINHHVGDKGATQFFLKALNVLYPGTAADIFAKDTPELKIIWSVVHYPRTDSVLKGLGQNGHYKDTCVPASIKATDDLKLRLNGPVAGTTKWFVCAAIINHIAVSAFGDYISWNPFYATATKQCAALRVRGIDCHVGRFVMSEHPVSIVGAVPDEELLALAAIIHAIAPGSTLAKAKVLPDIVAVAGHKFYNDLCVVKKNLFTQTINVTSSIDVVGADQSFAAGFGTIDKTESAVIDMYIDGDDGYVATTTTSAK